MRRTRARAATLAAAALALAVATGLSACGGSDDGITEAEARSVPIAGTLGGSNSGPGSAASAAADALAGVLATPAGFADSPADPMAGPITSQDQLSGIFADRPQDAQKIFASGFQAGHMSGWTQRTAGGAAASPSGIEASGLVLRFDTAANASAAVAYLRSSDTQDGYQMFAVPGGLSGGYGGSRVHGDATKVYTQTVTWAKGPLVIDLTLTSLAPLTSTGTITQMATAENARA